MYPHFLPLRDEAAARSHRHFPVCACIFLGHHTPGGPTPPFTVRNINSQHHHVDLARLGAIARSARVLRLSLSTLVPAPCCTSQGGTLKASRGPPPGSHHRAPRGHLVGASVSDPRGAHQRNFAVRWELSCAPPIAPAPPPPQRRAGGDVTQYAPLSPPTTVVDHAREWRMVRSAMEAFLVGEHSMPSASRLPPLAASRRRSQQLAAVCRRPPPLQAASAVLAAASQLWERMQGVATNRPEHTVALHGGTAGGRCVHAPRLQDQRSIKAPSGESGGGGARVRRAATILLRLGDGTQQPAGTLGRSAVRAPAWTRTRRRRRPTSCATRAGGNK